MMKNILTLLLFLSQISFSQRLLNQFPQVGGTVNAIAVDTASQTIFIGGDLQNVNGIARIAIAAIDYNTGALKPFNPNIAPVNNNQSITDLLVSGDTLFACGNFTSVQGNARQYICAFRISTGSLLAFNVNFNTWPFQMLMHKNKLYFRGTFSQGGYNSFAVVNRNTGAHYPFYLNGVSNNSAGRVYAFEIKYNKIYALCNSVNTFDPYNRFLAAFDINTGQMLDSVNCVFDIYYQGIKSRPMVSGKNALFVSTVDSVYYQKPGAVIAFDTILNLKNSCFTSQLSGSPNYNRGPNSLFHWDKILFTYGSSYSSWGSISGLPNFAAVSELSGEVVWTPNPKNNFLLSDFKVINDRLYLMGNFDTLENKPCKNFAVYDVKGLSTDSLITGADSVCKQSLYNMYTILLPQSLVYNWSYSGTGFTKFQNSNAGLFHFYFNTTPGNITCSISGTCNMDGPGFAQKPISFYPVPNVFAGYDTTLNCQATQLPLLASTNPGNSLQWILPGGNTSGLNPFTVDSSGTYIAKANSIKGCVNYDTVQVFVDTLKPVIGNLNSTYTIPCQPNFIQVNASSNSSNDSLWWQSTSLNFIPNPIQITQSGNYILHAKNLSNHCLQTDTILATLTTQTPQVILPSNIDTLSCIKDTISFFASHLAQEHAYWINMSKNDTISNPLHVTQPGYYRMVLIDTISHCSNQGVIFVSQNVSQSAFNLPQNLAEINCSYDSVLLNGSALQLGAQMYWTDSLQQNFSNPFYAKNGGQYYLTSIHPVSGCKRTDSLVVIKTNRIEIIHSNDTLVCKNSSIAIQGDAIGTFNNLNYYWNQAAGNNQFNYTAQTSAFVYLEINDQLNCYGRDSIKIDVAPELKSDSIQNIQPCDANNPNGQINWYVSGGIPPMNYFLNGNSNQSSSVFNQLNFGNYQLHVIDSLGCSLSKQTSITSNSNMPSAEFLVSTQQFLQDTFAIVDLTQPQADSVKWQFPLGTSIINTDPFNPIIVHSDSGSFNILLTAYVGSCTLSKTKQIHVYYRDSIIAIGSNQNGIKYFSISPNPNNGNFNYQFEFYKKQLASIVLYDSQSNIVFKQNYSETLGESQNLQIPSAQSGTYYLYLIGEFDAQGIIVIVNE